ELGERLHLDLADAFTGQIHDGSHVFQRRAAAIGDVERAGLAEVPHLEIRKVELDGAGARRHVDEQVVLAGDEWARARTVGALGAGPGLPVVRLRKEQTADFELALGHALDADRARAHVALAPRTPLLARDLGLQLERQRAVHGQRRLVLD